MTTVGMWTLGLVLLLAGGTLLWGSLAGLPLPLDVAAYWGFIPLLLGVELLVARWRAAAQARQTGRQVRVRLHAGAVGALAVVLIVAVIANAVAAFAGTDWWDWMHGPLGDITHPYEAAVTLEGRAAAAEGTREVVVEALPGRWTISGTQGPDVVVACDLTARAKTAELADAATGGAKVVIAQLGDTVTVTFFVPGYDRRVRNDVSPRAEGTIAVPQGLSLRVEESAGDVTLHDYSGEVEAKVAAGKLVLIGLSGPVDASVASGDVTARRVTGDLDISVAAGNVEVSDPEASVSVAVAAGNCVVRSVSPLAGDWTVTVSTGKVDIQFPRTSSVEVSAETRGSVSHNLGLSTTTSGTGRRTVTGILGAGEHRLEVRVQTGDIVLTGTDG